MGCCRFNSVCEFRLPSPVCVISPGLEYSSGNTGFSLCLYVRPGFSGVVWGLRSCSCKSAGIQGKRPSAYNAVRSMGLAMFPPCVDNSERIEMAYTIRSPMLSSVPSRPQRRSISRITSIPPFSREMLLLSTSNVCYSSMCYSSMYFKCIYSTMCI